MSTNDRDKIRVQHILQAISYVEEFVGKEDAKSFVKNYLIQSAVVRQFEIIGEAIGNISDDTRNKYPEVEWIKIKGFRNLLVHEYFRVDAIELWQTIEDDLPVLKEQMNGILKNIESK